MRRTVEKLLLSSTADDPLGGFPDPKDYVVEPIASDGRDRRYSSPNRFGQFVEDWKKADPRWAALAKKQQQWADADNAFYRFVTYGIKGGVRNAKLVPIGNKKVRVEIQSGHELPANVSVIAEFRQGQTHLSSFSPGFRAAQQKGQVVSAAKKAAAAERKAFGDASKKLRPQAVAAYDAYVATVPAVRENNIKRMLGRISGWLRMSKWSPVVIAREDRQWAESGGTKAEFDQWVARLNADVDALGMRDKFAQFFVENTDNQGGPWGAHQPFFIEFLISQKLLPAGAKPFTPSTASTWGTDWGGIPNFGYLS